MPQVYVAAAITTGVSMGVWGGLLWFMAGRHRKSRAAPTSGRRSRSARYCVDGCDWGRSCLTCPGGC